MAKNANESGIWTTVMSPLIIKMSQKNKLEYWSENPVLWHFDAGYLFLNKILIYDLQNIPSI